MKNFCISILFLFANFASCLWLDKCFAGDVPVKIAILGDTEKFKAEVDLLTAKLSEEKNLAVLDRADIDIILKEHEIFLSDISKNSVHLGKLLGADGVLIVKEIVNGGHRFLSTRLVAINPGVILDAFVFPLDIKSETLKWADSVELHFSPFFKKLSVSKDDALPVSLLNFRFATMKGMEMVWEKDLNMLVLYRLILEKRIFVNERWNLGQAAFEKEHQDPISEFWTGAKIVDGILSSDKNGTITAQVRIRTPDGRENFSSISGESEKLPELAEKLADFIIADSQIKSDIPAFDKEKEALEYRREAEWAYYNGLYEVALQAADAAWTLGDNSPGLAFTRIKACGGQLFKELQFDEGTFGMCGRSAVIIGDPDKYIDTLIYGLEINIMLFRQFEKETLPFRRDSVSILRLASVVLHSAFKKGLYTQEKYMDKIALLRSLSIKLFKLDVSIKDNNRYGYNQQYAYYLFFSYMAFFSDNFTQMKGLFEETVNIADPNKRGMILECLSKRMVDVPLFVDWTKEPPAFSSSNLLKEYLLSLIDSEKDRDKVNGLILANTVPKIMEISDAIPDKTMVLLWEKRTQIVESSLTPEGYEVLANFLSFQDFRENTDYMDKYIGFFLKYLDYYMEEYRKGKKTDWKFLYWLLSGIDSWRTADNMSASRDLIIAEKYKANYSRLEEFKKANQDLFLTSNDWFPNAIYEVLKNIFKGKMETSKLVEYERKVEGTFIPFSDFCSDGEVPVNLLALGSSSDKIYAVIGIKKNNTSITVQMLLEMSEDFSKKTHQLPEKPDVLNKLPGFSPTPFNGSRIICVQDRKIYYINPEGIVWVFDPPKDNWNLVYNSESRFQSAFISKGYLYIAYGAVDLDVDSLLSYMNKYKTADWQLKREKYLETKESGTGIVKISLADFSESLFASSRRKPGSTPLDDRPSYAVKKMMEDDNGILYVSVERDRIQSLYAFNSNTGEWKLFKKPNPIKAIPLNTLKNGHYIPHSSLFLSVLLPNYWFADTV